MAKTLSSQLDTVQTAIERIESGAQSVLVDGVTITRANLKTLYDREAHLLRKIERGTSGSARRVAEF